MVADPRVKDALSGTWLGHPVHPMLTDLPIGFWTSALVLDVVGGKKSRRAAQRLIAFGILSAIPTAVTGAADWSDTDTPDKRVGLVHGLLNTAAVLTFVSSWRARHRGHHLRGIALGAVGRRHRLGCRVPRGSPRGRAGRRRRGTTAFDPEPAEWTPVCQELDVSERPLRAQALHESVMVVRDDGEIVAVAATCPHRGAPWRRARSRTVPSSARGTGAASASATARCSGARPRCP